MKQIWRCRRETEKNISLAFVLKLNQPAELLKTAASGSYRIFADGQLLFKGPLRGAHGQSYIVSLPIPTGCKVIVAEVCHAGIHSYSEVSEQPFFAAEVFHKGVLIADSKDFSAYRLTDRLQKVQRYSFQRTFVESYRMQRDRTALFSDDIPFPKEKTLPRKKENPSSSAKKPSRIRRAEEMGEKKRKQEEIANKFSMGDSVMVYPEKKLGIVFASANERGEVGVQIQKKKSYVSYKRLKLQGRVRFLGYRKDLEVLLQGIDIFLFPSV